MKSLLLEPETYPGTVWLRGTNMRIVTPPEARRNVARDTMVDGVTNTRVVRYTRRILTQTCVRLFHLWSRPYLPTNDLTADTLNRKRCDVPRRDSRTRGCTSIETGSLRTEPTAAAYSVWITGWTATLNAPPAAVVTVASSRTWLVRPNG